MKRLLIVLFSCFVAELIAENWAGAPLYRLLALDCGRISIATAWQIFTHVLVEPPVPQAVASVLISLLFMWLILSPFEERFGAMRTFQLALFATLIGGVAALIVGSGIRSEFVLSGSQTISLAGIAAMAVSLRDQPMLFFGVIPMRPIHLIWVTVVYSTLMFLASRNVVVFAASLGAIGAGILFVKWITRPRRPSRTRKRSRSSLRVLWGDGEKKSKPPKWLN